MLQKQPPTLTITCGGSPGIERCVIAAMMDSGWAGYDGYAPMQGWGDSPYLFDAYPNLKPLDDDTSDDVDNANMGWTRQAGIAIVTSDGQKNERADHLERQANRMYAGHLICSPDMLAMQLRNAYLFHGERKSDVRITVISALDPDEDTYKLQERWRDPIIDAIGEARAILSRRRIG